MKYIATDRLTSKSRCGYLAIGSDEHEGREFTLRSGGRPNLDTFKFNVEVKCRYCEREAFFTGHRTYVDKELVKVTPRAGLPLDRFVFWVKSDGHNWIVTPPEELLKSCAHLQALFTQYVRAV